jgi:uncharacterized membrane protein
MSEKVQTKSKGINIYDIAICALFAAVCYVATNFRIEIPTPLGKTMIHCGNIFCLLSCLLMGGLRGGASDAVGLGLFDLLNGWASSAPSTIIMRFVMGLVGGSVASIGGKENRKWGWTLAGAASGMVTYIILYLSYSFVRGLVLGNAVQTVLTDVGAKAITSSLSGTLSVIIATLLYPVFQKALAKAGYYAKARK